MPATPLITTFFAAFAAILFIAFLVVSSFGRPGMQRNQWMLPALLSLVFLVFSVYTVWTEGPIGFWVEHTRNLWGNQIWFDLLLAASIGWFLILPQAKALGMRLPIWILLVAGTGSIGFMAMLARMLWLREQGQRPR